MSQKEPIAADLWGRQFVPSSLRVDGIGPMTCPVCQEQFYTQHLCSGIPRPKQLTEADIRRIVREELDAAEARRNER